MKVKWNLLFVRFWINEFSIFLQSDWEYQFGVDQSEDWFSDPEHSPGWFSFIFIPISPHESWSLDALGAQSWILLRCTVSVFPHSQIGRLSLFASESVGQWQFQELQGSGIGHSIISFWRFKSVWLRVKQIWKVSHNAIEKGNAWAALSL